MDRWLPSRSSQGAAKRVPRFVPKKAQEAIKKGGGHEERRGAQLPAGVGVVTVTMPTDQLLGMITCPHCKKGIKLFCA